MLLATVLTALLACTATIIIAMTAGITSSTILQMAAVLQHLDSLVKFVADVSSLAPLA